MITREYAIEAAKHIIRDMEEPIESIMSEDENFYIFSPNHKQDDQTVWVSRESGEIVMYSAPYEFHLQKPTDKIWHAENPELKGPMYFTFDRKKFFNYWTDYPKNLTREQKEIFDREYPYWADFRKSDNQSENQNTRGEEDEYRTESEAS